MQSPVRAPAEVLADLDTQLMLQVQQGSRDAANALVRRNFERIERYLGRLVSDKRAAEDLTQDVFLQAFSHAQQYAPTARVSTWLYRLATNIALNHLKQPAIRRRTAAVPEGMHEPADGDAAPPYEQLRAAEVRRQVADAVASLPVNQRVALTLFEYEGCSYEQIAGVLEATVEAVRSLLMRARTTLRARLREVL